MLLGDYTTSGGNVARLLLALQELERWDILEDQGFQDSLRKFWVYGVVQMRSIEIRAQYYIELYRSIYMYNVSRCVNSK